MVPVLTHLHAALWTLLPWEVCLAVGLLCWHVMRLCSPGARYLPRAAAMVTGLLIGLALPVFLRTPEVWALPLFATGASFSLVATIRLPMSRSARGGRFWVRLSRGIWCLSVGFYLAYGANRYAALHHVISIAWALIVALSVLAALHFTAALISCARGQKAWSMRSFDASFGAGRGDERGMAGDTGGAQILPGVPGGEPYPFDYPTISSATGHPEAHGRQISRWRVASPE